MPNGFVRLDLARFTPTEWLYAPYMPFSGVTVVSGYPACFKTTLLCDIAARVTRGYPMPLQDTPSVQGAVLYFVSEDTRDSLRQRISAAASDLSMIHVKDDRDLLLPSGINQMYAAAAETGAKLIVIDPLESFVECSLTNGRAMREVMDGLNRIARALNLSVIVIRHFTKTSAGSAIYRGAGSVPITAAARSELMLSVHPHDPSLRVLSQLKSSLAAPGPSLAFRVRQGDVPRLEWLGTCPFTSAQLLDEPNPRDRPALEEAKRVLFSILGEGPVGVKDAFDIAKDAGISERTLRRAKEALNVESVRSGFGPGSIYRWQLPSEDDPAVSGLWAELRREQQESLVVPARLSPQSAGDQNRATSPRRSIIRD